MVLSSGDPGECAARRGHRHLLSLPTSVSVADRRAGVGARTGGSAPTHWPRANVIHPPILPNGCEVHRSYPQAGLSDLLWIRGYQGLDLVHHGRKVLGVMEGALCSSMPSLDQSWSLDCL